MKRKRLLLLLVLLAAVVTGAWAQGPWISGDCTVTLSGDVMTVSGTGAIEDYEDYNQTPWYGNYIKTIVIESGVTSIGVYAFAGCYDLESVSIPASVTSIGEEAFRGCYMLANVCIYAPSLTTYGADAFDDNASGRKIYVLPEAVDTYKAGWSDYAADIEAMTVYETSVKEGTEDAENWSATPSLATEGQAVTITYAGTKSVKSVTAKRKTTTGNITVYFTDAQNYGDVNIYYWNDGPTWPGTAMTEVGTNEYSQKIYRAEIPATAVGIIFNGNGNQTVDITKNIADGSWWYTTDQFNGAKNEVGYVGKWYEVKNVDDNKWTFTMTDGDMELDIEYYPAYSVTISDGDVDAANWSATPAEQIAGQNVTLQYTGRKKIKRITIVAAPTARTAAEATAEDIGKLIGADGNIYDDAAAATAASTTAVAMIAYVGSETGEAAPYNHGLALALSDANDGNTCKWMTSYDDAGHTQQTSSTFTEESGLQYNAMHNSEIDNYPAFKAAIANNGTAAPTGCSAWFLASGYQWQKMIDAAGLSNLGLQGGTRYWSSTEYWAYVAWDFISDNGNWSDDDKGFFYQVRACLAF